MSAGENKSAEAYVAPDVQELGTFESLTKAQYSGTQGDWRAANGQPIPILS